MNNMKVQEILLVFKNKYGVWKSTHHDRQFLETKKLHIIFKYQYGATSLSLYHLFRHIMCTVCITFMWFLAVLIRVRYISGVENENIN